jgi:hypothetical protein
LALTPFGNFTLDWTAKPTKISGQASNFKTWLNTRTEDLKTYINDTLIPAIESRVLTTTLSATTDSASGADQIGATAISGWAGATVQAIMESAKADVDLKETIANVNEVKRRMLMGVSYFG